MLHHGLGSLSAWRELPVAIAETTGLPVVAYSRRGYGGSAPTDTLPWPADFMHREARGEEPLPLRAVGATAETRRRGAGASRVR